MHDWNWEDDEYRCIKAAAEGSEFCEEHQKVRVCKTTGLRFMFGGMGGMNWWKVIPPHPVGDGRTKRAVFCECEGDRCRNLWRDTRGRIERGEAIDRAIEGLPSDRYSIIKNYNGTGNTVVYDKKAHRRLS